MSIGIITAPSFGGWTLAQLVDLADRRTERRGSRVLDLKSECLLALQELCMDRRWHWRRKMTHLWTKADQWSYDLTDKTDNGEPNAADLVQYCEHGVTITSPSGEVGEVTPLFDPIDQAVATQTRDKNYGMPSRYWASLDSPLIINFAPTPDQKYLLRINYWACPVFSPDALPEELPLIPAYMHHVLLAKLEARIFQFTLGEGSAKYQAAVASYNGLVEKYAIYNAFAPGMVSDVTDKRSDDSVQSTN